jgi:HrpA-like RNA helicase
VLPLELTYPAQLPITERRAEIVETLRARQVVIVAGETGSGKSTQLPKMCMEAGRGEHGLIGHTQPRRLAARTIAERVAEELGTELGAVVGYTVRFTDRVGPDTRIKVMTDGILLAEIQRDRMLRRYDTIIIDEAHERSLNIDFLMGYLHQLLPQRPDLHIVITSATIDTARFAEHFAGAPVIEVSGRTFPVEVRYRPFGTGSTTAPITTTRPMIATTTSATPAARRLIAMTTTAARRRAEMTVGTGVAVVAVVGGHVSSRRSSTSATRSRLSSTRSASWRRPGPATCWCS